MLIISVCIGQDEWIYYNASAGVHLYTIQAGEYRTTKKMILLKSTITPVLKINFKSLKKTKRINECAH